MQRVQHLLLEREPRLLSFHHRHLLVGLQVASEFLKELASNIRHRIQRRRLKVFEAGVVEDLAHGALECMSTHPGCHERTIFAHYDRSNVGLDKRLRIILLKLVLVGLRLYLHLLNDSDLGADFPGLLHLPNVAFHLASEIAIGGSKGLLREHSHVLVCLWHNIAF